MPTKLPRLPALVEMRRLCRRVTRAVPELTLAGHRLVVHDIRPHVQANKSVLEHVHSFYEAHIVLEGQGLYSMGETQIIGPGGMLLHGPHTPHAWQQSEKPCLRLLIWFSIDPIVRVPRPSSWPIHPDLLWDLALLFDDADARQPGWGYRVTARVTVVLSRLLTIADWPSTQAPPPEPRHHLVALVDHYLQDNLARPVTLEDVADHVGMGQRTLCRQFQTLTGSTVIERLFNIRMDRAAQLLSATNQSLSEIGLTVGMPDPSYFCRRFRFRFHITPNQYRVQGSSLNQ